MRKLVTINWKIPVCILMLLAVNLHACVGPCLAVDNAFQWWTPVYMDMPVFNPKIRYYLESNPRLNDNLEGINQHIWRNALGYKIRRNIAFYQGFAIINNFLPKNIEEYRSYQQLGVGHVIKKRLQVLHRFRNEQRWFSARDGTAARLRYMLRLAYPLRNTMFYLVGYDELFVNVNSLRGGPVRGIDQNRLFVGLGRQINKRLRAEIGYQNQWVNRQDPTADKAAHILLTQMFINF